MLKFNVEKILAEIFHLIILTISLKSENGWPIIDTAVFHWFMTAQFFSQNGDEVKKTKC